MVKLKERRSSMKNEQTIAIYFWLLLVPLFWGGAFVAAEHIMTEIPPITASALRFGPAGIILIILVLIRGNINLKSIKKQWSGLLLMALTGIFGYNMFFFFGLELTSAINGSLIMATSPVFITLGAVLFFRENWNRQLGLGLLLSLFGVIVVISGGSLHTLLQLTFNMGDLLFIGGLMCWVAHGLLGRIVMKDVSPLTTTAITTLTGAVMAGLASLFERGWGDVLVMSTQAWLEMVFMIVFSSVIAFFLWNQGIQQIGASRSSIYMNLVPISTALIAVSLYGSRITFVQIFGMMMVIIGVYFVTLHSYLKKRNNEHKWREVQ